MCSSSPMFPAFSHPVPTLAPKAGKLEAAPMLVVPNLPNLPSLFHVCACVGVGGCGRAQGRAPVHTRAHAQAPQINVGKVGKVGKRQERRGLFLPTLVFEGWEGWEQGLGKGQA